MRTALKLLIILSLASCQSEKETQSEKDQSPGPETIANQPITDSNKKENHSQEKAECLISVFIALLSFCTVANASPYLDETAIKSFIEIFPEYKKIRIFSKKLLN